MSKLAFFRQSGWMVIATTVAGGLMSVVHKSAKEMGDDYSVFTLFLAVLNMMAIPSVGLQLVFAQLSVDATERGRRAELVGALRAVFKGTFVIWLLLVAVGLGWQQKWMVDYKISNPMALWVTLVLGLTSLWTPVVTGILQGRQNFLWLGWSAMLNGLTRLVAITVIVVFLGGHAAGGMTGVLLGMVVSLGIGAWQLKDLWAGPAARFEWLPWLKRVAPLTLGFGAITYMVTADYPVVQRFFSKEEARLYGAVGTIGRALFFFTAPMTAVLFPKVVQSAVRAEKSSVLAQALGATALLGGGAALACTFVPQLPLRILFDESFLPVAPLLRLFAWCILPFTLSTVLANNLLARERYAIVPWLLGVAAAYHAALWYRHDSFEWVVGTLGLFGMILLTVCAIFTWRENQSRSALNRSAAPATK